MSELHPFNDIRHAPSGYDSPFYEFAYDAVSPDESAGFAHHQERQFMLERQMRDYADSVGHFGHAGTGVGYGTSFTTDSASPRTDPRLLLLLLGDD